MENAKEMLVSQGKLALKVTPRARHDAVEGLNSAGELVVKVRATPENGEANRAVIALLAAVFSLPKGALSITRGGAARHKMIAYRP